MSIYILDKYNLQTGIMSFPNHENLLKEVVVTLVGQRPILAKKGTFFKIRAEKGLTTVFEPVFKCFE